MASPLRSEVASSGDRTPRWVAPRRTRRRLLQLLLCHWLYDADSEQTWRGRLLQNVRVRLRAWRTVDRHLHPVQHITAKDSAIQPTSDTRSTADERSTLYCPFPPLNVALTLNPNPWVPNTDTDLNNQTVIRRPNPNNLNRNRNNPYANPNLNPITLNPNPNWRRMFAMVVFAVVMIRALDCDSKDLSSHWPCLKDFSGWPRD